MGRFPFQVLFGLILLTVSLNDVLASDGGGVPSESECRPYIEKAINELKTGDHSEISEHDGDLSPEIIADENVSNFQTDKESPDSVERQQDEVDDINANDDNDNDTDNDDDDDDDESTTKSSEANDVESKLSEEENDDLKSEEAETIKSDNEKSQSSEKKDDDNDDSNADDDDQKSEEEDTEPENVENMSQATKDDDDGSESQEAKSSSETPENDADDGAKSEEVKDNETPPYSGGVFTESTENQNESIDRSKRSLDEDMPSTENETDGEAEDDDDVKDSKEATDAEEVADKTIDGPSVASNEADADKDNKEDGINSSELKTDEVDTNESTEREIKETEEKLEDGNKEDGSEETEGSITKEESDKDGSADGTGSEEETKPEDELLWEGEIPETLRNRNHITELLRLDEEFDAREKAVDRVAETILREIKKIYENGIKPLETMYKYRDLSNRHFSDPEIFSKPLVLFMGPWSGGKSSIINYLTGNEYTPFSLRTGAEPSPAYFNILMWGNETEILDGTQLAADYTFSGLQKFGQGLEDRLRGVKLPSKLLEKINIVEIPGILEVRKQVSRLFPFNDACQWFIDRADIIFLVYDPAKLDVGPETEAILDQLKGREYQTRIILNKADTVKPEELLRIQSALIWNISPIMSSAQPPLMYTASLWSHPYGSGAPVRLLQAQERAFLRDLREAIDRRIEHKISSARRFAVRVRNHVKMVDCYLNTFYNHKTLFSNKKRIADNIIENPQNYHIYEGLSTLTNISRYDLPDAEVYRDFFRLNPLYEFRRLSETCTFFRGCPINKLDVAIAYDLPELAGKYKKAAEAALAKIERSELSKS